MAGTKEIRTKIKSVQNTRKVTRALEMVSASKIRKAQDKMKASRPYSRLMRQVIGHVAKANTEYKHPFLVERADIKRVGYLVISTDRGLCGGYNAGVQRAAEGEIKADVLRGRDYSVIAVGRKAESYFRFRGYKIKTTFSGFSDAPGYANAKEIGQHVVDLFVNGEVDRVELIYTRFISAGSQEVVQRPLVPLERETVAGGDGRHSSSPESAAGDFEYEPDPTTILDSLLPKYVEARIYAALLNAAASEHAFRQRAMKSATDNAEELIKNLSRIMNRARQDSITTEIMEIVSGAEALSGVDLGLVIDFEVMHDGSPDAA